MRSVSGSAAVLRVASNMGGIAHIDVARLRVISPLLDQLLDTTPDERQARLNEIRSSDDLLASELERLLASHQAANRRSFMAGTVLPATHVDLEGQPVGSYTLEAVIGQGGMGSVWLRAAAATAASSGRSPIKFLNLALLGRRRRRALPPRGQRSSRGCRIRTSRACSTPASRRTGQPYLDARARRGRADRPLVRRRAASASRLGCGCSSTCSTRWRTRTAT